MPLMGAGGACASNLKVIQSATASRIVIQGGRAVGVQYIKTDAPEGQQNRQISATKEVISSAGPFGSPRLLQLSGIGPPSVLNDLGVDVVLNLPVGQDTLVRRPRFATYPTSQTRSPCAVACIGSMRTLAARCWAQQRFLAACCRPPLMIRSPPGRAAASSCALVPFCVSAPCMQQRMARAVPICALTCGHACSHSMRAAAHALEALQGAPWSQKSCTRHFPHNAPPPSLPQWSLASSRYIHWYMQCTSATCLPTCGSAICSCAGRLAPSRCASRMASTVQRGCHTFLLPAAHAACMRMP